MDMGCLCWGHGDIGCLQWGDWRSLHHRGYGDVGMWGRWVSSVGMRIYIGGHGDIGVISGEMGPSGVLVEDVGMEGVLVGDVGTWGLLMGDMGHWGHHRGYGNTEWNGIKTLCPEGPPSPTPPTLTSSRSFPHAVPMASPHTWWPCGDGVVAAVGVW